MSNFRHTSREIERSANAVDHTVSHPLGTKPSTGWAQSQTLHVAVMYSNPLRFRARLKLFQDFRRTFSAMPNIKLHAVEVAFGDRPFEVTSKSNTNDLQFRTREEIWHKENALNLAIQRFDSSWEYGAWVDGDVMFNRHDWALETIHQLQHFDWVQPFSSHIDLGPNHEVIGSRAGMAYLYHHGLMAQTTGVTPPEDSDNEYWKGGAPGFAWAFRREAFAACGGLMDKCILGSADLHMALGLIGSSQLTYDTRECGDAYKKYIKNWQERARRKIKGNVGFVNCALTHGWHGPRAKRGYNWRWKILRDFKYDPNTDIYFDDQGLLCLTDTKPGLRDAIRAYLRSRHEDSISLTGD